MSEIPDRRLRFTLILDVNSIDELLSELDRIGTDVLIGDREERDVTSSAGYWYKLEVQDPDMNPERYKEAVDAWLVEQRASRRR